MLLKLAHLGTETPDGDHDVVGRRRLEELQADISGELERLLMQPVLPPELKDYVPGPLARIDRGQLSRTLAATRVRLTGVQYIAGPREKRPDWRHKLQSAFIVDCRFDGVDFSRATFSEDTRLVRSRFVRCNFDQIQASKLRASSLVFENCTFNEADLSGAAFSDSIIISDADVTSEAVDLREATISYCNFSGVRWPRASMLNATIIRSFFDEAILTGLSADEVVFCETSAVGADLTGASLRDAFFRNCDFRNVVLVDPIEERPAIMTGADLSTVFNIDTATFLPSQRQGSDRWPPEGGVGILPRLNAVLRGAPGAVDRSAGAQADERAVHDT
jgi:uncharacterized protein YjbI with pentapeptide repeats